VSGAKEIRTKITSITSTQKITSAMQMVAASKMRKSQQAMENTKPYSERIRDVVGHIANANPEYRHSFMGEREVKKIGLIIVSSDRGLCGGLNTNTFKLSIRNMKEWQDENVKTDLCLIGSKGSAFFKSLGGNIRAAVENLGDIPSMNDLVGGIKVMLDAYEDFEIDRLFIVYNQFVNTMVQKPIKLQLLPLKPEDNNDYKHYWDYIYEPDARTLLDGLLVRYIESQIYQAVVENNCCEQAARMIAMKSATDNAGELIDELQLVYNKARQAAITQEISEIVSGAAAI